MQAALEQRQDLRSQPPVPAPISRMRKPRPSGRLRAATHRGGDGREPVAGEETVAIKLIEQLRADAGEQNLHGVLFAAQNRSQFGTISRKEALREDGRDVSRCSCAEFSRRNPPPWQNPASAQTRFSFFRSKPCLTRPAINRSKTGRIGVATPEGRCIKGFLAAYSHFAQPASQLRGREIVEGAKRRLQFGVTRGRRRLVQCASARRSAIEPAGAAAVQALDDSLGIRSQAT